MLRKPVSALLVACALVLAAGCGGGGKTSGATGASGKNAEPTRSAAARSLVVIGDSLPYARDDCGGCASFATLFAAKIGSAGGAPASVQNLATHDGVTTSVLLQRVTAAGAVRQALAAADVVVVSAGHNDTPWNRNDDTCDGPSGDNIDWSRFTTACALREAQKFGVSLDGLLREVTTIRAGKPTAIRVINFYNDWIGGPGVPPAATAGSKLVLDAFSKVICDVAAARGALCVDSYHAFNGQNGLQPAGKLLARDYTHPSATGHQRIAELLTASGLAPLR